eukprot:Tbor_TRINITY_DN5062_c0_g1::TRINITY_DN5062_c0_g1_i1::g.14412::m.14412
MSKNKIVIRNLPYDMTAQSLMGLIHEHPATHPHTESFTLVTFRKGKAPNKLKSRMQPIFGWAIIQSSSVALVPTLAGVFDSKIIPSVMGCEKKLNSDNAEESPEVQGVANFPYHTVPCSVEYTPLQDSSLPAKLPAKDDKLCGTIFSDPSFMEFCSALAGQTGCSDDIGCEDGGVSGTEPNGTEANDYNARIKRWLAEKEEKEAQFKAGVLSGGNNDLINGVIGYWYENKKPLWMQSDQDSLSDQPEVREPKPKEERSRKRGRRRDRRHKEREVSEAHKENSRKRDPDSKRSVKGHVIDEDYIRKPKILTVEEEILRNEKRLLEKEKLKEEKKKLSELIDRKRIERQSRRERKAAQEARPRGSHIVVANGDRRTTPSFSDLPSLPGNSSNVKPVTGVSSLPSENNSKIKWGNRPINTIQEEKVCPINGENDVRNGYTDKSAKNENRRSGVPVVLTRNNKDKPMRLCTPPE